jgi:hypothetical protein
MENLSHKCGLIGREDAGLKVDVFYICAPGGGNTESYARRFVETWRKFPPARECGLVVVINSNGTPLGEALVGLFSPVAKRFLVRRNDGGKDISGFQEAARQTDADFMVCLGESCYFHRAGWLARWVEARNRFGPGMYGVFASIIKRPHLNTTAFGVEPVILKSYPMVADGRGRYDFEHGKWSFADWVRSKAGAVELVTFDGVWAEPDWRKPDNVLWRGDQSNCLVHCRHTEEWSKADAVTKFRWEENADKNCWK